MDIFSRKTRSRNPLLFCSYYK